MSPAYSFSLPDFESLIPEGIKVRTTRLLKDGKRYEQALKSMAEGRPVRLYWKQRSKDCRLLLEAPIVEVEKVVMYPAAEDMQYPTVDELKYHMMLERKGQMTTYAERNLYAREEGFAEDNQLGDNKWPTLEEAWEHYFPGLDYVEQHRAFDDALHEALLIRAMHIAGDFRLDGGDADAHN